MRLISAFITLLLSISLCACTSAGQENSHEVNSVQEYEQASIVRVVDGDTLIVRLSSGVEERLRLIGIDAPESVSSDESRNTEEGRKSAAFLQTLVAPGDTVWLMKDVSDRDKYDRLLRYVWLEMPRDPNNEEEVATKMLNGILVAQGYAEPRNYEPDSRYKDIFRDIEASVYAQASFPSKTR